MGEMINPEDHKTIDLWNMGCLANEIVKCTNYLTKNQVLGKIWRVRRKYPELFTRPKDYTKRRPWKQKPKDGKPYGIQTYD